MLLWGDAEIFKGWMTITSKVSVGSCHLHSLSLPGGELSSYALLLMSSAVGSFFIATEHSWAETFYSCEETRPPSLSELSVLVPVGRLTKLTSC